MESHVKLKPVETNTAGVYLAGSCQGPKDIPQSVAQGSAAAAKVLALFSKDMYHDEYGFDALALDSPLDRTERTGEGAVLEENFAGNLVGLILASDLFTARNLGPRPWIEGLVLATSWSGATIRFSGERLSQDDLDTLLGCVLLAFRNPGRSAGATRFSLRDLTRLIRPTGRRFAARCLERSLWRLAAARLEIESGAGQILIQTRLIHALLCDSAAGVCSTEINPRIMNYSMF